MINEQFSHVFIFSFSYFSYKKKVATPHHLPKKINALKSIQITFFLEALLRSLTVATPLGMSRDKFHIRLK